jgi:tRNA threonylcarbamoyladenosine biosynthesis protein TsaE
MFYTSANENETKKIAAEFARTLKGGELVFLVGDLGSGKTTFVRGFAEALGYHDPVRSPSFTLVNRYKVSKNCIAEIIHVDLYRIKTSDELRALALDEEIGRNDAVIFIEWPERAEGLLGKSSHEIRFTVSNNTYGIDIITRRP